MNEVPTKEQLKAQKNKLMLASMKSAKDNMAIALHRIESLEGTVANLADLVDKMMEHVAPISFPYDINESYRDRYKKMKLEFMKGV